MSTNNENHRFLARDDRGRFKPKAEDGCPDPDCDGEVSDMTMPSGMIKQTCNGCNWWVLLA